MAAGRFSRNTVLAGVFVLVAIGLFAFAIVLLSKGGEWVTSGSEYTIRFDLDEGADGLEKGSAVKLGGKRIGSVLGVDFDPKPGTDQEVKSIVVRIQVDSRLRLYNDAKVTLVKPLLGSNSALNIIQLRVKPDAPLIAPGGEIEGQLAPPGFVSQADYAKFQGIVDKTERIASRIERWTGVVDPTVDQMVSNVDRTLRDASELVADVKKQWGDWRKPVDETLALLRDRADSISRGVSDGVTEARKLISDYDKVITDNRGRIDEVIESVRSVVKRFETEEYAKVSAAIENARDALARIQSAARSADEFVATKRPELDEIVTKSALAADQLKLMLVEVRAAPWRLLYQPNKKELENELLYNSIRQYSASLSEARAAAEALESAAKSLAATPAGARPSVEPSTIDSLTLKLRESLSQSLDREKQFFDRWVGEQHK